MASFCQVDSKALVQNILSQGNWWAINKPLSHKIGLSETAFLMELVYQETVAEDKGTKNEDGFFPCTQEILEENTSFAERSQRRYCKKLEDYALIKTTRKGDRAKKWYKLNHETIQEALAGSFCVPDLIGQNGRSKKSSTNSQNGRSKSAKKSDQNRPNDPNPTFSYKRKKEKKRRKNNKQNPDSTDNKSIDLTDSKTVWRAVLPRLEKRIDRPSFDTWIRPIQLVSIKNGICKIEVPDKEFMYWLPKHYEGVIMEALVEVLGQVSGIKFQVIKIKT